jgi:hypothetical protein
MSTYTPDRWVVIETIADDGTKTLKVLSSWYGGYTGSDSWKLSSGITETKDLEDRYEFLNYSGSTYICYKQAYGASNYTSMIFAGWQEKLPGKINIVEGYHD